MITLAERLEVLEQFVLGHKPPPEIRTHLHVLQEHLEMDASLIDQIAEKDAAHAKLVAEMLAEKTVVDDELAKFKSASNRPKRETLRVFRTQLAGRGR